MKPEKSPGKRLRDAWSASTIAIPGVFNPLVARMAERIGFQAVYLSGAALSATLALPDIGLVTLTEFVEFARALVRATSLPVLCDADTGFGEAVNVERTVRLFEEAGVAGIHLEDQELPKRCGHLSGKNLVSVETMVSKIRTAVASRRDPNFVIMARTDARGVTGMEDALLRAQNYLDAGADAIFPEAMEGLEDFQKFASAFASRIPLLANMTEFGKSPILDQSVLANLGFRMVLYPVSTLRSALHATQETLNAIQNQGHQKGQMDAMLTRRELYSLLDYEGYEARDQVHFGPNRRKQ